MKSRIQLSLTILKYVYSLVLIIVLFIKFNSTQTLIVQLLELIALFFVFNAFSLKKSKWRVVVNAVVMLLFNAQLLIMLFGTSYLSMIMLSNITLVKDISGKFYIYIPNVILAVVFSILPHTHIKWKCPEKLRAFKGVLWGAPLALWLVVSFVLGASLSPLLSYGVLGVDFYNVKANEAKINKYKEEYAKNHQDATDSGDGEMAEDDSEFYRKGINAGFSEELFEGKPNIIYIMVEGLSQSIVDDPRNIMPNLREYEDKSLNFVNYFDHSSATFRGIIGQLYSGHQYENHEVNHLVGIQDVLEDEGYKSIFINTEPYIDEFVEYLNGLSFDEVVSEEGEYEGDVDTLSDKEAFERMEAKIIEEHESKDPYFITMYTFGTHATLGSPHKHFNEENNPELDKFYNVDFWFGEFMDWFNNAGELTDNTLLVFTADHATYMDGDWINTFPDSPRENLWVDTVPCIFYHKGVTPRNIDVDGKNTINIAPTILDYVNVGEERPNYFLGDSLFAEVEDNFFDTIFYCKDYPDLIDTKGSVIRVIQGDEASEIMERINSYLAKKLTPRRR